MIALVEIALETLPKGIAIMEPKARSTNYALVSAIFACIAALGVFVLRPSIQYVKQCRQYSANLGAQWLLIDQIVRQVPDPNLQKEGSTALALTNVWGNTMQAEFFPGNRSPRSLEQMTRVTEELEQLATGATADNAATRLIQVYDLLLDNASNKEFVLRYREVDFESFQALKTARPDRAEADN